MSIAEQLRAAITGSGLSIYRIAKDSGVSQPNVLRFASGERDVRLETAAKLAAYLGLELAPKAVKPRSGRSKSR